MLMLKRYFSKIQLPSLLFIVVVILGGIAILFATGILRDGKIITETTPPAGPADCSNCQIPIYDTRIAPINPQTGLEDWEYGRKVLCDEVPEGGACNPDLWNKVKDRAIAEGINPVMLIALWGEESGFGKVSKAELGCLDGNYSSDRATNLENQLNCFFKDDDPSTPTKEDQGKGKYSLGASANSPGPGGEYCGTFATHQCPTCGLSGFASGFGTPFCDFIHAYCRWTDCRLNGELEPLGQGCHYIVGGFYRFYSLMRPEGCAPPPPIGNLAVTKTPYYPGYSVNQPVQIVPEGLTTPIATTTLSTYLFKNIKAGKYNVWVRYPDDPGWTIKYSVGSKAATKQIPFTLYVDLPTGVEKWARATIQVSADTTTGLWWHFSPPPDSGLIPFPDVGGGGALPIISNLSVTNVPSCSDGVYGQNPQVRTTFNVSYVTEVWYELYKKGTLAWNTSWKSLNPDTSNYSLTVDIPSLSPNTLYQWRVRAIGPNGSVDWTWGPNWNVPLCTKIPAPEPDLFVGGINASASGLVGSGGQYWVNSGVPVQFSTGISNLTVTDTQSSFQVEWRVNDTVIPGYIDGTQTSQHPQVNGNTSESRNHDTASYTFSTNGVYTVSLCADSSSVIPEKDESNNCSSITVNVGPIPPDLIIVDCDGNENTVCLFNQSGVQTTSFSAGEQITASFGVRSINSLASNFWIDLWNGSDAWHTSGCNNPNPNASLSIGQLTDILTNYSLTFTAPSNPGSYWGTMIVDSRGSNTFCSVAEQEENNNWATFSFSVTASASPDLVPQYLTRSILYPSQGNILTFSGIVKNQGSGGAAASYARFCIDNSSCGTSTNGRIGPTDVDVPALQANASSSTLTAYATWVASAGSHTLYFCVNTGSSPIAESNTTNNCISQTFTVASSSNPNADSDNDGFTDNIETYIGTDRNAKCASTATANDESPPDRWPVDFNDDQKVTITDLGAFIRVLNLRIGKDTLYDKRFDLTGDGLISLSDDLTMASSYNFTTCAPRPDLIVQSVSFSPNPSTRGSSMNFTGVVKNQGTASAGTTSYTKLRIDVDNNGSWDVIGTNKQTAALAAGATETETWSSAWTAKSGIHKFEICADFYNSVTNESSGSNNCTSKTFIVAPSSPYTFYLSDLAYNVISNGWGPVEKDKSNGEWNAGDGRTITLNGITYTKGLGVHAYSEIKYPISGICSNFSAKVGVDDEVGSNGSVVFQVWADGTKLYDSGTMTGTTATKTVNVSLTGKNELSLIVTDAGDNNFFDHADWANAKLTCGS